MLRRMRGKVSKGTALRIRDPLLQRGWQHDGRQPMNPANPGLRPQKVPDLV